MPDRMKRRLPFVSVAALTVSVVSLVLVDRQKDESLRETDANRPMVESAVAEVQSVRPASVEDGAFRQALARLAGSAHVAYVWGVGTDGAVFFSNARFTRGDQIEQHATVETRRILTELPAGYLSAGQRIAMLTASAIQSEGEHNDVFQQLVRPIRAESGVDLGFIGVAYSTSSGDHRLPGPGYLIPLLLVPFGLAIYWLALVWWVYLDARTRSEPAWLWACFVLLGNFVALFAYLLVRPRALQTVG